MAGADVAAARETSALSTNPAALSQPRGQVFDAPLAGAFALDVAWLAYGRALRAQMLAASNPDNPLAPPTIQSTVRLDWRDQTVVAAGLADTLDDGANAYGGVNYGRNPIPPATLNPLLASIGEWHLTAGYARNLDDRWSVSAALEYLVPIEISYSNPQLPFGPGAQERESYLAAMLMFSRRW